MSQNPTHEGGKAANRRGRRKPQAEVKKLTQRGFISFLISPPVAGDAGEESKGSTEQGPEWRLVEEKIGAAKSLMDPYEGDPQLAEALRAVDIYSGLKPKVRRHYNGQAVTNAWLKMYEMTTEMGLVPAVRVPDGSNPQYTHVLRAFCNAELPGAFICALNHYLCTWHPETRFEWAASSLYPDPGNTAGRGDGEASGDILGDYYGLYEHNPDRWLMSPGMRGDVTSVADVLDLVAEAKARLGKVDLYTSDAGIGVSDDYLRQEELTARIHLGQILVGLMSLRVGGALVVKTYTFVHPSSISLMAVCASVFDHFYVTKPVTSRPANSEVYIIGLGFRGLAPALEAHLLASVEKFDFGRTLLPLGTPETEDTVASLLAAAREIHLRQQVACVTEAVAFYKAYRGRLSNLRQDLQPVARRVQDAWLCKNPLRRIPPKCQIPDNDNSKGKKTEGSSASNEDD
jgi:hypothetical protein